MLKIIKEYKFQLGGSIFHASEGDCIKVRLKSGVIMVGNLLAVGIDSECFDLDTEDNFMAKPTTIDCEDVVDIIQV